MLFNSLGNLDSDRNSAFAHWIHDYLHTDETVVEKGIDHVTESTRRINKMTTKSFWENERMVDKSTGQCL